MMQSKRGWLRALMVVVGASLLVLTASIGRSVAAHNDFANLNSGFGNSAKFDIALAKDGVVTQADTAAVSWKLDTTKPLVPGHSVTATITVFNNGPYDAEIGLRLVDKTPSSQALNAYSRYRWSVKDATTGAVLAGAPGTPLTSTVTPGGLEDAVKPFTLKARGANALADGADYTAGATGSARTLTFTIAYPDTAGVEAFNGASSAIEIQFLAESA